MVGVAVSLLGKKATRTTAFYAIATDYATLANQNQAQDE